MICSGLCGFLMHILSWCSWSSFSLWLDTFSFGKCLANIFSNTDSASFLFSLFQVSSYMYARSFSSHLICFLALLCSLKKKKLLLHSLQSGVFCFFSMLIIFIHPSIWMFSTWKSVSSLILSQSVSKLLLNSSTDFLKTIDQFFGDSLSFHLFSQTYYSVILTQMSDDSNLQYLWVYFYFLVLEHQVLFSGVLGNF